MVLSYRHSFHAGNFADVMKHASVALLLQSFHRKPAAFYYLDTHAGSAYTQLRHSVMAQKTREWEGGIARVWQRRDYPRALEPYLTCVRALNGLQPGTEASAIRYAMPASQRAAERRMFAWNHVLHHSAFTPSDDQPLPHFADSLPSAAFEESTLQLYPGSSLMAAFFQRQTKLRLEGRDQLEPIADRAVLCELHKAEFEALQHFYSVPSKGKLERVRQQAAAASPSSPPSSSSSSSDLLFDPSSLSHPLSFATRRRFHVMHHSGFRALMSSNNNVFLAPAQGRGLVLIDPPYESADEVDELLRALPTAYNRFRQGTYAIWYPIIDYSPRSPRKLDVDRFHSQLHAMRIPNLLCLELDLVDSIRAAKRGLTPEQAADQARELPRLDSELFDSSSKFNSERERGLGMTGTGLIVINPPFGFEQQARSLLDYLADVLPQAATLTGRTQPVTYPARTKLEWINAESAERVKAVQVLPPLQRGGDKHKTKQQQQQQTDEDESHAADPLVFTTR